MELREEEVMTQLKVLEAEEKLWKVVPIIAATPVEIRSMYSCSTSYVCKNNNIDLDEN
jgi:hypothetical protein